MDDMQALLASARTIAVVGLSSKPWRDSYHVADYMQEQGYRIVPVNPRETEILGEPVMRSLADIDGPVDIVNVFRRSEEAGAVVDEAIRIGARAVWLQLGIVDEAAAARAQAAGLAVIMDRCILIEHKRIFGK